MNSAGKMNGKGGYCIARYGGGGSFGGGGGGDGGMYGMSKVESIMLKFRPIAPKPVAAGSGSGGGSTGNSDEYVNCGRSKRKYVRVNKTKKKKDNFKKKVRATSSSSPAVTLSLLPETPDRRENEPVTGFSDLLSPVQMSKCNYAYDNKKLPPAPVWLSFNNPEKIRVDMTIMKPSGPRWRRTQVVSNVTVECVTDTWVDLDGLRCTDEERVMNMEKDTCPGFISDGQDRVVWMNKAYRQMAGLGHVVDGDEILVVLVWKDKLTPSTVTYPAFTCKVRVTSRATHCPQQTPSPCSPTLTLPCDVWRMERGAYAWRLDVKAALSLGR